MPDYELVETSRSRSLSIIIPNYNGAHLISEFFPSVLTAASNFQGDYEIIIVDDASTDNSRMVISYFANKHKFIKAIFAETNGGFSKSCNLGISIAQKEICFFLNTDVTLDHDIFNHFQKHFENPNLFAVTICGYRMYTQEQIDGIKIGKWHRGKLRTTENLFDNDIERLKLKPPFNSFSVQGAYFFADTAKLKQLNGFDEIYSPYFMEETDIAYRALKKGWNITYEPDCRAWHQVSASVKSAASKFRIKTISARNNLFFTWKNIHSSRLIWSHLLFLVLRLLTLNIVEWTALIKALPMVGVILKKRRLEIQNSVRSDEEIMRCV